jgi:hypothetical protein
MPRVQGRDAAKHGAVSQCLPTALLPVIGHRLADGPRDDERERLAVHGFQPGVGVLDHHQQNP